MSGARKARKTVEEQRVKAKPVSLAPLKTEDAIRGLLEIKPKNRRESATVADEKVSEPDPYE